MAIFEFHKIDLLLLLLFLHQKLLIKMQRPIEQITINTLRLLFDLIKSLRILLTE